MATGGGAAVLSSSSPHRGTSLWFFPFLVCFCSTFPSFFFYSVSLSKLMSASPKSHLFPFCFNLSSLSFPLCFSFFSFAPPVFFFCCLLPFSSPSLLGPPLAFIARGCIRYGRYMVTAGVHYDGEEISRETCLPLIAAPPLLFLLQKPLLEDSEQCAVILNETAQFQFQNDISDLVFGCFYNFVIKPPRKSCNWIFLF